ncbi:MAG: hypothetical protein ACHREM_15060, partial [Polyangiales bacterium]
SARHPQSSAASQWLALARSLEGVSGYPLAASAVTAVPVPQVGRGPHHHGFHPQHHHFQPGHHHHHRPQMPGYPQGYPGGYGAADGGDVDVDVQASAQAGPLTQTNPYAQLAFPMYPQVGALHEHYPHRFGHHDHPVQHGHHHHGEYSALRLNWMYGVPMGLGSAYGMPRVGAAASGPTVADFASMLANAWGQGGPSSSDLTKLLGQAAAAAATQTGAAPTVNDIAALLGQAFGSNAPSSSDLTKLLSQAASAAMQTGADSGPSVVDLSALPLDMRATLACIVAECRSPLAADLVANVLQQGEQGHNYLVEGEKVAAGGSGLRLAFLHAWSGNGPMCALFCHAVCAAAAQHPTCHVATHWAASCAAAFPQFCAAAMPVSESLLSLPMAPAAAPMPVHVEAPTVGAFATQAYNEMGSKMSVGEDVLAQAAQAPMVVLARVKATPEANLIASRQISHQLEGLDHLLPEGHGALLSTLVETVCRALRMLDLAGRDPKIRAYLHQQTRGHGRKAKELRGALLLADELQTKGAVQLPTLG